MDLEVQSKTRKTWRMQLNLRVSYLGGGDKRAKRSTSAAGELGTEWAWKCSPKHAIDRQFEEYQRSTDVLNLRVAYLKGGNKRAQRSTSTAGGLSVEWAWKYRTEVSYLGGAVELESARIVPWGRG
jgi:hypothetical protein